MTTTATERVVLCDDDGRAVGTASKATVHHARTPLHLAFSSYVFDDEGRLLVTRRALAKRTWPGTRTNTCCGHPGPGEAMDEAVTRRLRGELGVSVRDLRLVLPRFRYRAEMADGTVENELCPVWLATIDAAGTRRNSGPDAAPGGAPDAAPDAAPDPGLAPDPDEVGAAWWQRWPDFVAAAADTADPLSPWALVQLPQLVALGPDPLRWPTADRADLPAAARS